MLESTSDPALQAEDIARMISVGSIVELGMEGVA